MKYVSPIICIRYLQNLILSLTYRCFLVSYMSTLKHTLYISVNLGLRDGNE